MSLSGHPGRRLIGGELSKDQTEVSTFLSSPRRQSEANVNSSGKKETVFLVTQQIVWTTDRLAKCYHLTIFSLMNNKDLRIKRYKALFLNFCIFKCSETLSGR